MNIDHYGAVWKARKKGVAYLFTLTMSGSLYRQQADCLPRIERLDGMFREIEDASDEIVRQEFTALRRLR